MQRSLKSRALQLLAQRDQSRLELRRKLLRHAQEAAAAAAARADSGIESESESKTEVDPAAVAAEVDALLDWLEENRFLSDERFAESRVRVRQARCGVRRIRNELAQHGLELPPELAQALAGSELERAAAVRERRFGAPPDGVAARAAQSRFLIGRGFAPELVQRLMRALSRSAAAPASAVSVGD